MPPFQTLTIGERTIDLFKFTGEVVEEKLWTTTQVSGGGGGYNVGSGQQNPVSISSTSVKHNQFFLKSQTGEEKAIELIDSSVALRKGNRITIFWGIIRGNPAGPYVAVINHTLNTSTTFASSITSLAAPPGSCWMTAAWVASIFAICFYGIGLIAIIALILYARTRGKLKKQYIATLQSALDAAIAQSIQSP